MLELGRLTQDFIQLFQPVGRWLFVKVVVLAFTATALGRLVPKKPRRTIGKRPKRAAGLWAATAVLAVAAVAALGVLALKADRQLTVIKRQQLIAFQNRPAHAELAADSGAYFGLYEPSAPSTYSQVRQFAAETQSQPRISLYYSNWKEPFQTSFADASYTSNSVTMIQMLPTGVDLATIAEGGSDSYLRSYAKAVRTFRHPVIIGFAPEMNGNWYKWGYQNTSPATWVAAWRHVVDVFRANGADNVSWLWTVNEIYQDSGPLNQYWPGKSYVTWVGIDAYFVPQKHSFNSVVVPTLRNVRRITSAPVIISETGIAPGAGKVATLQQLFSGVRAQHLLGFVYFDGNQPQGANYHYRWRLEDSPAAMAEYATLARQYEADGQDAPSSADTVASKP